MKIDTCNILNQPITDAVTRKFLENINNRNEPQIFEVSLQDARSRAVAAQQQPYIKLPAEIKDLTIPVGPEGNVDIRIVRPSDSPQKLPVVMYFHGGGWVLNNKDTHDRLIRELAVRVHAVVVFVEYSRSPEVRFPTAIEEAYAATKWIAENCNYINADPRRIAVGGDSSGANMATVVCMMAKKKGGPRIIYQVLLFPTTSADFDSSSYTQFGEGYFLTKKMMKWFWDQYSPHDSTRSHGLVSPLKATLDELSDLPSALIITAELDVLRDEGEAYARRLIEAGVEVTATRYLGAIHGFVFLNELATTPSAKSATEQTVFHLRQAFLKELFDGKTTLEEAFKNG